jgi:hypothetical protein
LGLISMADDFGRLHDSPKQIEAFVWPHEERSRDCRDSLARLARMGRIVRGATASGQRVIQIANWSKHQRVDKPSVKAALPEIVAASTDPDPEPNTSRNGRESLASDSRSDLDLDQRSPINDQRISERKPTAADVSQATIDLTVAANQGISAKFGEQPTPLLAAHGKSHALAQALLDAGIPIAFAQRSVARQCQSLAAPVRSMAYFEKGIREHWAQLQAHEQAAGSAPVTPLEQHTKRRGSAAWDDVA